jgi:hypothetical protein
MRREDIGANVAQASGGASLTVDKPGMFSDCSCMVFHRAEGPAFEAYQPVLSDPDGKLLWEAGYDERLRPLQVALWEAPEAEMGL